MAIVLCDVSGLAYWRHRGPFARAAESVVSAEEANSVLRSFAPKRPEVDAVKTRGFLPAAKSEKVHLLVSSANHRRRTPGTICHLCTISLAKGTLCSAGRGVYVMSPEFCLAQRARHEDRIGILLLLLEFCGLYSMRPDLPRGIVQRRNPLVTTASLRAFLQETPGVGGSKRLSAATALAVDRVASPMEAYLYLLLCLPRRMGGYGLPSPIPNFEESVLGGAKKLTAKHWCSTDLCWPDAKVIFEYDSDAEHVGADRIATDSERRDALADMLYQVYTVTNRQIHSEGAVDELAHVVARSLGIRWDKPTQGFLQTRRALRRRLFWSKGHD